MTAAISTAQEPIDNRRAWRDRWASPLAVVIAAGHLFSALVGLGWYYYIVPRTKHVLFDYGVEITSQAKFLIGVSDAVVNYWYLLVPVAPVVMITDFLFTRWVARHIGLRYACLCGLIVGILILSNVGVGQYLLHRADIEAATILKGRLVTPVNPAP